MTENQPEKGKTWEWLASSVAPGMVVCIMLTTAGRVLVGHGTGKRAEDADAAAFDACLAQIAEAPAT